MPDKKEIGARDAIKWIQCCTYHLSMRSTHFCANMLSLYLRHHERNIASLTKDGEHTNGIRARALLNISFQIARWWKRTIVRFQKRMRWLRGFRIFSPSNTRTKPLHSSVYGSFSHQLLFIYFHIFNFRTKIDRLRKRIGYWMLADREETRKIVEQNATKFCYWNNVQRKLIVCTPFMLLFVLNRSEANDAPCLSCKI